MNIGNRIQSYRKQIGLSQEELAYKIGVSRQTVSKWERDECLPEIDKIMMLCDLYNISTDELLGRRENHAPVSESSKIVEVETVPNQKKKKADIIMLASGLAGIIISVLLTEVWTLIDKARSGSWYSNPLHYLFKSPLAIVFFSSIIVIIIGLVIIIRKFVIKSAKKGPHQKSVVIGTIIMFASVIFSVFVFLLSKTGIFVVQIGPDSYADYSGLSPSIFVLCFIAGLIITITGIVSKRRKI